MKNSKDIIKMNEIENKYGTTFKVGQLVEITKQFSDMKKQVRIEKLSSRYIYVKGYSKFCIDKMYNGLTGNVCYLKIV